MQSVTFTTAAEVIRCLGADPDLIDVDNKPSGLTSEIFEKAIERHPKVKTLIAVYFGGLALSVSGENGIGTSVHFKPIHKLSFYKNRYRLEVEEFPNSEAIWQSTVSLPIYNLVMPSEIDEVCDAIAPAEFYCQRADFLYRIAAGVTKAKPSPR